LHSAKPTAAIRLARTVQRTNNTETLPKGKIPTRATLGRKLKLEILHTAMTAKAVHGTTQTMAQTVTVLTQKAVAISAPKLATRLSAIDWIYYGK
jgi:hypothetical protein